MVIKSRNRTKQLNVCSTTTEGSMCCHDNTMFLTKLDQRLPLEIRMCLELIHCRLDLRVCQAISSQRWVIIAINGRRQKESVLRLEKQFKWACVGDVSFLEWAALTMQNLVHLEHRVKEIGFCFHFLSFWAVFLRKNLEMNHSCHWNTTHKTPKKMLNCLSSQNRLWQIFKNV